MKGWTLLNRKRREDKLSESGKELVAHTNLYTTKTNDRNHHIPLNMNTEC
jgi:hypothetical protein